MRGDGNLPLISQQTGGRGTQGAGQGNYRSDRRVEIAGLYPAYVVGRQCGEGSELRYAQALLLTQVAQPAAESAQRVLLSVHNKR